MDLDAYVSYIILSEQKGVYTSLLYFCRCLYGVQGERNKNRTVRHWEQRVEGREEWECMHNIQGMVLAKTRSLMYGG